MRRFAENPADVEYLKGKTVAILGYGNQGRAHALNLRDSGVNVVIGQRPGPSFEKAKQDDFEPVSVSEATHRADVLSLTLPDVRMGEIYAQEIAPFARSGKCLVLAHGFAVLYRVILPSPELDVVLVGPKGAGAGVRSLFQQGSGVPALVSVHQNPSGHAETVALGYATALGCFRTGLVMETTLQHETESDLFGEQAVLCGGIPELIKASYDTLVKAGFPPELAYFECLHETKLVVDLLVQRGVAGMRSAISDTAAWGGLSEGPKVIDDGVKERLAELLSRIQTGEFAQEWIAESGSRQRFSSLQEHEAQHDAERIGAELRKKLYPES